MDETAQDVSAEQVTDANPQEQQDTKKPFLKTWKPWVIALALIFFWAWCQNPANSYDAKQKEKSRAEFSAAIESLVSQSFDGCKVEQDGDILTVSMWSKEVTVYSAALLVATGDMASINKMESSLQILCETTQSKADEMNTGLIVRVQLMDGSNTSNPLCVIQNGEFVQHFVD